MVVYEKAPVEVFFIAGLTLPVCRATNRCALCKRRKSERGNQSLNLLNILPAPAV